jgi:hypothetical protein
MRAEGPPQPGRLPHQEQHPVLLFNLNDALH